MTHGDPNPFQATLVKLHERWNPEQIADAISALDKDGYPFSRALVLYLSTLEQRQSAPLSRLPIEAGSNVEAVSLGTCQVCHVNDAVLLSEQPPGSGKVQKYCGKCLPKRAEEEEVATTAGA